MFNPLIFLAFLCREQPPSGGCVLKLLNGNYWKVESKAAAFGRLCVETNVLTKQDYLNLAAAFGRLCVETMRAIKLELMQQAAAFGRLCVET